MRSVCSCPSGTPIRPSPTRCSRRLTLPLPTALRRSRRGKRVSERRVGVRGTGAASLGFQYQTAISFLPIERLQRSFPLQYPLALTLATDTDPPASADRGAVGGGREQLFGADGEIANPDPGGVIDRVGNRRRRPSDANFPDSTSAERIEDRIRLNDPLSPRRHVLEALRQLIRPKSPPTDE